MLLSSPNSMLAEKLNMTPEEAERWIVNLIRNARLDAKIDSKLVCLRPVNIIVHLQWSLCILMLGCEGMTGQYAMFSVVIIFHKTDVMTI